MKKTLKHIGFKILKESKAISKGNNDNLHITYHDIYFGIDG